MARAAKRLPNGALATTKEELAALRHRVEEGAAARPGVLALTHFYPPVEAVDIRGEVATRFDGRVVLATDGWSLDLEER